MNHFLKIFFFFVILFFLIVFSKIVNAQSIPNPLSCDDFGECIEMLIGFVFWLAVVLTPLMIILAAFFFLTSGGDPGRIRTAKSIIFWTVIGLFIVLLARGIISVIRGVLGG